LRFPLPTTAQVAESADALGLHLTDEYVRSYLSYVQRWAASYETLAQLPEDAPVADHYQRSRPYRPKGGENRFNAWYYKCRIAGASDGPLKGRRVALKDNVCVAGVPMMNGASILDGFIPDLDATVVARLLDAGAEIVGKAVAEYFSFSGGSNTAATGAVESPNFPGYSVGGSSSGSAALVASGEVDMAVGGDQSGSVRIPARYAGIVGIKPTFGLVPYTGIMSIDATIDHVGLLTSTVAESALFLEALAGPDGLDSRQGSAPQTTRYTDELHGGVKGLRVGLLSEGFGRAESEQAVDDQVRAAARDLTESGCTVEEVSIPWHKNAIPIWAPIGIQGSYSVMWLNGGVGSNHQGVYITALVKAMSDMRLRADELPDTVKFVSLFAHHAQRYHGARFYAKAQNVTRQLRHAYDEVLARYDVLLLPTTPMRASRAPDANATLEEFMNHSLGMIGNTCAFDITGHPAISIPCTPAGELSVGMMLVGRHYDEGTLYRVANSYEHSSMRQKSL
jgi:amidase